VTAVRSGSRTAHPVAGSTPAQEVAVVWVRAYAWFVAALIWSVVLLVAAIRFT